MMITINNMFTLNRRLGLNTYLSSGGDNLAYTSCFYHAFLVMLLDIVEFRGEGDTEYASYTEITGTDTVS